MRTIAGYFLIVSGFISYYYFSRYRGVLIPYPWLWAILSIAIFIVGLFLAFRVPPKLKKMIDDDMARAQRLKATGERIPVDFDSCTFGDRSFKHIVEDQKVYALNVLINGGTSADTQLQMDIAQSYLTFKVNDEVFMASFGVDEVTLKSYVITHTLFLFVSRSDRTDYIFGVVQT